MMEIGGCKANKDSFFFFLGCGVDLCRVRLPVVTLSQSLMSWQRDSNPQNISEAPVSNHYHNICIYTYFIIKKTTHKKKS